MQGHVDGGHAARDTQRDAKTQAQIHVPKAFPILQKCANSSRRRCLGKKRHRLPRSAMTSPGDRQQAAGPLGIGANAGIGGIEAKPESLS